MATASATTVRASRSYSASTSMSRSDTARRPLAPLVVKYRPSFSTCVMTAPGMARSAFSDVRLVRNT